MQFTRTIACVLLPVLAAMTPISATAQNLLEQIFNKSKEILEEEINRQINRNGRSDNGDYLTTGQIYSGGRGREDVEYFRIDKTHFSSSPIDLAEVILKGCRHRKAYITVGNARRGGATMEILVMVEDWRQLFTPSAAIDSPPFDAADVETETISSLSRDIVNHTLKNTCDGRGLDQYLVTYFAVDDGALELEALQQRKKQLGSSMQGFEAHLEDLKRKTPRVRQKKYNIVDAWYSAADNWRPTHVFVGMDKHTTRLKQTRAEIAGLRKHLNDRDRLCGEEIARKASEPELDGRPFWAWFSGTYKVAAMDQVNALAYPNTWPKATFYCIKSVKYEGAAPNPYGGKGARIRITGYDWELKPVYAVKDIYY